jgi:hypothetical protein
MVIVGSRRLSESSKSHQSALDVLGVLVPEFAVEELEGPGDGTLPSGSCR